MLALLLMVLLSPFMVFISIILLLTGNGVFFVQLRIGLLEQPFSLYKFKTMKDGITTSEEERITGIGNILRKTSLDELPQLWNILKGEMSFIGPRPLLEEYLPLYSQQHAKRHWVLPGITGLAQVNGRNDLSWQEKFDLDVFYQENLSFFLDVKILLLTISYFINGSRGNHPAEKFMGYN